MLRKEIPCLINGQHTTIYAYAETKAALELRTMEMINLARSQGHIIPTEILKNSCRQEDRP